MREEIIYLIKEGLTNKAVARKLCKEGVKVGEHSVGRVLKEYQSKEKEGRKIELIENRIYLNIDESFVPLRIKNKLVELMRGRVVSVYTNRILDPIKKRPKLENKRYFVEIYRAGEKVDNFDYLERLTRFIKSNYKIAIDENTTIFGAVDGAKHLKMIVNSLPNSVLIASKFHVSRNWDEPWYLRNNKEGMRNWSNPHSLGCSAESDVAKVKGKLGFGNRIYCLASFKNLLRLDNMIVP